MRFSLMLHKKIISSILKKYHGTWISFISLGLLTMKWQTFWFLMFINGVLFCQILSVPSIIEKFKSRIQTHYNLTLNCFYFIYTSRKMSSDGRGISD
jgi:hypothetical protein